MKINCKILLFPWVLFLLLGIRTNGQRCGGVLKGSSGTFKFHGYDDPAKFESGGSPCLWIIQIFDGDFILFNLDRISDPQLRINLYHNPGSSLPIKQLSKTEEKTRTGVRSRTLVVILTHDSGSIPADVSVTFSWKSTPASKAQIRGPAGTNTNTTMFNVSPVDRSHVSEISADKGLISWDQFAQFPKTTAWLHLNLDLDSPPSSSSMLSMRVKTVFKGSSQSCGSHSFGLYKISQKGFLSPIKRFCDAGSTDEELLEDLSFQILAYLHQVSSDSSSEEISEESYPVASNDLVELRWRIKDDLQDSSESQSEESSSEESSSESFESEPSAVSMETFSISTTSESLVPSSSTVVTPSTSVATFLPSVVKPLSSAVTVNYIESRCLQNETIAPCSCSTHIYPILGSEFRCEGAKVSQNTFENLFKTLQKVHESLLKERTRLRFHSLTIFNTSVTSVDLTPFIDSNITLRYLYIQNNPNLKSIVGPPLLTTTDPFGRIDVTDKLWISGSPLNDSGIGNALHYFSERMQSLEIINCEVTGSQYKVKVKSNLTVDSENEDDHDLVEFLPGLSRLTNLYMINLYRNHIKEVAGGQFRKNIKLSLLSLGQNQMTMGDSAFLIDIDASRVKRLPSLRISLLYNNLTIDNFLNTNNGIAATFTKLDEYQIKGELSLFGNNIDSISQAAFEEILLASADVEIDFSFNPLICDERMSWLKALAEGRQKVVGGTCRNDGYKSIWNTELIPTP